MILSQNNSLALEHFVLGFLNGLKLNSGFDFWIKPYPITREQSYLWIDKFCRENPLSTPIRGIVVLFDERKSESN